MIFFSAGWRRTRFPCPCKHSIWLAKCELVKGIPPNTPNRRRAERRVMNHAETGEGRAFLDDAEGI